MPYVNPKYQTKGQKKNNRGNNIPYKFLTAGQKAALGKKKKNYRGRKRYNRW